MKGFWPGWHLWDQRLYGATVGNGYGLRLLLVYPPGPPGWPLYEMGWDTGLDVLLV